MFRETFFLWIGWLATRCCVFFWKKALPCCHVVLLVLAVNPVLHKYVSFSPLNTNRSTCTKSPLPGDCFFASIRLQTGLQRISLFPLFDFQVRFIILTFVGSWCGAAAFLSSWTLILQSPCEFRQTLISSTSRNTYPSLSVCLFLSCICIFAGKKQRLKCCFKNVTCLLLCTWTDKDEVYAFP